MSARAATTSQVKLEILVTSRRTRAGRGGLGRSRRESVSWDCRELRLPGSCEVESQCFLALDRELLRIAYLKTSITEVRLICHKT